MTEAAGELPFFSRYQALTDGEAAWATDGKGTLYRFDGLCFSRRRRRDGSFSLVPSWQTPSYGWLHPSDCPCAVWILAPVRDPYSLSRPANDLAA